MINGTRKNPITALFIILATSVASLGLHAYLALQHFGLKYGTAVGESLCTINSTFNCDVVAMSPYSELFGIPMAVWGTSFHVIFILFIVSAISGLSGQSERLHRFIQLFSIFSLLVAVVMGGISLLFMSTYCLFCIGTYVLSVIGFIAALGLGQLKLSEYKNDVSLIFSSEKWILIMLLLVPGFGILGHMILKDRFGGSRVQFLAQESIASWKAATPVAFDLENGLSFGKNDASFVIVEFADFLCPHCKFASPTLHGFTQARPDVRLVFKIYPLDGSCNTEMQKAGDGLRCKLAGLAVCAETLAKKGWTASDWIFEHQERHSVARWTQDLAEVSSLIGSTSETLTACIESPETASKIKAMVQEAATAKIRGTPAIFVNGKLLEGGQMYEILSNTYKAAKAL